MSNNNNNTIANTTTPINRDSNKKKKSKKSIQRRAPPIPGLPHFTPFKNISNLPLFSTLFSNTNRSNTITSKSKSISTSTSTSASTKTYSSKVGTSDTSIDISATPVVSTFSSLVSNLSSRSSHTQSQLQGHEQKQEQKQTQKQVNISSNPRNNTFPQYTTTTDVTQSSTSTNQEDHIPRSTLPPPSSSSSSSSSSSRSTTQQSMLYDLWFKAATIIIPRSLSLITDDSASNVITNDTIDKSNTNISVNDDKYNNNNNNNHGNDNDDHNNNDSDDDDDDDDETNTNTQVIQEILSIIQPCDLILVRTPGAFYEFCRNSANQLYDHLGIVLTKTHFLHIGPPVIRLLPISTILTHDRDPLLLRPRLQEVEKNKFLDMCNAIIGYQYSTLFAYQQVYALYNDKGTKNYLYKKEMEDFKRQYDKTELVTSGKITSVTSTATATTATAAITTESKPKYETSDLQSLLSGTSAGVGVGVDVGVGDITSTLKPNSPLYLDKTSNITYTNITDSAHNSTHNSTSKSTKTQRPKFDSLGFPRIYEDEEQSLQSTQPTQSTQRTDATISLSLPTHIPTPSSTPTLLPTPSVPFTPTRSQFPTFQDISPHMVHSLNTRKEKYICTDSILYRLLYVSPLFRKCLADRLEYLDYSITTAIVTTGTKVSQHRKFKSKSKASASGFSLNDVLRFASSLPLIRRGSLLGSINELDHEIIDQEYDQHQCIRYDIDHANRADNAHNAFNNQPSFNEDEKPFFSVLYSKSTGFIPQTQYENQYLLENIVKSRVTQTTQTTHKPNNNTNNNNNTNPLKRFLIENHSFIKNINSNTTSPLDDDTNIDDPYKIHSQTLKYNRKIQDLYDGFIIQALSPRDFPKPLRKVVYLTDDEKGGEKEDEKENENQSDRNSESESGSGSGSGSGSHDHNNQNNHNMSIFNGFKPMSTTQNNQNSHNNPDVQDVPEMTSKTTLKNIKNINPLQLYTNSPIPLPLVVNNLNSNITTATNNATNNAMNIYQNLRIQQTKITQNVISLLSALQISTSVDRKKKDRKGYDANHNERGNERRKKGTITTTTPSAAISGISSNIISNTVNSVSTITSSINHSILYALQVVQKEIIAAQQIQNIHRSQRRLIQFDYDRQDETNIKTDMGTDTGTDTEILYLSPSSQSPRRNMVLDNSNTRSRTLNLTRDDVQNQSPKKTSGIPWYLLPTTISSSIPRSATYIEIDSKTGKPTSNLVSHTGRSITDSNLVGTSTGIASIDHGRSSTTPNSTTSSYIHYNSYALPSSASPKSSKLQWITSDGNILSSHTLTKFLSLLTIGHRRLDAERENIGHVNRTDTISTYYDRLLGKYRHFFTLVRNLQIPPTRKNNDVVGDDVGDGGNANNNDIPTSRWNSPNLHRLYQEIETYSDTITSFYQKSTKRYKKTYKKYQSKTKDHINMLIEKGIEYGFNQFPIHNTLSSLDLDLGVDLDNTRDRRDEITTQTTPNLLLSIPSLMKQYSNLGINGIYHQLLRFVHQRSKEYTQILVKYTFWNIWRYAKPMVRLYIITYLLSFYFPAVMIVHKPMGRLLMSIYVFGSILKATVERERKRQHQARPRTNEDAKTRTTLTPSNSTVITANSTVITANPTQVDNFKSIYTQNQDNNTQNNTSLSTNNINTPTTSMIPTTFFSNIPLKIFSKL